MLWFFGQTLQRSCWRSEFRAAQQTCCESEPERIGRGEKHCVQLHIKLTRTQSLSLTHNTVVLVFKTFFACSLCFFLRAEPRTHNALIFSCIHFPFHTHTHLRHLCCNEKQHDAGGDPDYASDAWRCKTR